MNPGEAGCSHRQGRVTAVCLGHGGTKDDGIERSGTLRCHCVRPLLKPQHFQVCGCSRKKLDKSLIQLASPIGFEPTAPGLGILCSILLSYGDIHQTRRLYKSAPATSTAPRPITRSLVSGDSASAASSAVADTVF